jgi:serine/threonine protein kinase
VFAPQSEQQFVDSPLPVGHNANSSFGDGVCAMGLPLDPQETASLPPASPAENVTAEPATVDAAPPGVDRWATVDFLHTVGERLASYPKIPGYEILGELGRGGMGVVYKARQEKVNRLVALKMVLGSSCASPEARLRFLLEGEVLGRLQHPNIVQIYEVDTCEGQPYFALEYVEGGSLADLLKQHKSFAPQEAAALVETLARAVHFAHSNGVIHRDLKPANILLTRNPKSEPSNPKQIQNIKSETKAETKAVSDLLASDFGFVSDLRVRISDLVPKITDFGLAKQTQVGTGLTASGAVMGTPAYMAPEQAEGKGKQSTAATDVYALGAILYELLAGRPPFVADSPLDVIVKVVSEEPPSVSSLRAKLPRDLVTICHQCLQKEPTKRYATAEALADDLRRFLEDRPIHARPVTTSERVWRWCRRNRTVASLLITVLLVLVAGIIVATALALDARHKEGVARGEKDRADREAAVAKAQQQRADQEALTAKAEKERADGERNNARRLLGLQAVREGLRLADQGDLFTALLWFAEPLVRDPDNTETAIVARGRIAAYRHHTPAPRLCQLLKHGASVYHAVFSPDGRWIVTASDDKTARVWDAATGQPRTPPLRHQDIVRHAAFSPDGRWLLTTSYDKTARVWALPEENRPKKDLLRLVQFLSGHYLDDTGGLIPLPSDEFVKAFQTLRAKYPDDFRASPAIARQWRQEQIAECMQSGNLPGALLHRDWMIVEAIREQAK